MISVWNIQKIRTARREVNLTVKAAADTLNITPEYLSMIENGHRQPSQKLIVRMATLYEKGIDYFLESEKKLAVA